MTRRRPEIAMTLFACLAVAAAGAAQEEAAPETSPEEAAMMAAFQASMTPGAEHEHLASAVGAWKVSYTVWMPGSEEPLVGEGSAELAMELGGRVLAETFRSEFMGMPLLGMARTGFDNVTGEYWSTWTDTMSTAVTLMAGTYDAATSTWTWDGETSDPMIGGRKPMRIVDRADGPDRHVATFFEPAADGAMTRTMELVYERQ